MTNRAKIIATLGPASHHEETLKALIQAGVNVFRLNMSHGTLDQHRQTVARVRAVSAQLDRPIALLADLQGPKIRTGPLKNHQPIELKDGQIVLFTTAQHEGEPGIITTNYLELISGLKPGNLVLINDGQLELEVLEKVDEKTLKCRVVQGGLLDERKGINVPEAPLGMESLTEKDRIDALFCAEQKIDYIALSFVRRAQDIEDLKELFLQLDYAVPPIIAKIEKPEALVDIDAIIAKADGLMVARGDLGVELSMERVPVIQKQLVAKANAAGKPVIIATQMLESMIRMLHPTRAEATDVANAVFDGADAMMLSGETAMGEHPIHAVAMMRKIIEEAEQHVELYQNSAHEEYHRTSPNFYDAIAHSATYAARRAEVKAIVVFSSSGSMARRISKLKPKQDIIALTPDSTVYNRLALLWGVTPLTIPFEGNSDEILARGEAAILAHQFLQMGDSVVFCGGNTPVRGASNMLKIYRIGEKLP